MSERTTKEDMLALINNSTEATLGEMQSCTKEANNAYEKGSMLESASELGRRSGLDYCLSVLQTMRYIVQNHWKE